MAELKRYMRLRAGDMLAWSGGYDFKIWRTYVKFGSDTFFTQLCSGTITADDEQSGHPASYAGDFDNDTYWYGIGDGQGIIFDLADDITAAGDPATFSGIRFYSDYYNVPKIVRVDVSDDLLEWTNIGGWGVPDAAYWLWGYYDGEWYEFLTPDEESPQPIDIVLSSPHFEPETLADESGAVDFTPYRNVSMFRVTLTGDGETPAVADIELPATNITARLRSGTNSTINVTVPGEAFAGAVAARSNGDIVLSWVYRVSFAGDETAEEILSVHLTGITPQKGASGSSIQIAGAQQYTHTDTDTAEIPRITYQAPNQTDGRYTWQLPAPVLGLRPVMSASYAGETIEIGEIQINASPTGQQVYLKEA